MSFDHVRCARKLAENLSKPAGPEDRRRGRSRGRTRHRIPPAELARIDAIIAARWPTTDTVEAIATTIGHSAPFVSRRAAAMGLPERRKDRRRV